MTSFYQFLLVFFVLYKVIFTFVKHKFSFTNIKTDVGIFWNKVLNTLKTYYIVEMTEISKKDDFYAMVKPEKTGSLLKDVAVEIRRKYDTVKTVITRLMDDVYDEQIFDDKGSFIRKKTHVPPQLLKWVREARMFCNDIWKMSGGEIQHEGEKKAIEIQAKLVLNAIGDDPDKYRERLEEWKKSRSFKK